LFWAALRTLHHRQNAEDAVQHVFASFIRARASMTRGRFPARIRPGIFRKSAPERVVGVGRVSLVAA
jgi:hypothetical protein